MDIVGNEVRLSSGRRFMVERGTITEITERLLAIDSGVTPAHPATDLSEAERSEIAGYMMERWRKFGGLPALSTELEPRSEHVALARAMELAVRGRPPQKTAHAMRAKVIAMNEALTVQRCAGIADEMAQQERLKGAGTMLRKEKGEATDADVARYVARHNMALEVAAALRAGSAPPLPAAKKGGAK